MMRKIHVAAHLSNSEYKLLLQVYANHNRSMGLEKRNNYTLSKIVKVETDQTGKGLNVYYKNGDWWHYSVDGSWY